ncbi:PTS system N-acetylglucosamine-specific IIB component (Glc family) /PTS system N-acetylglucosamine-specific IIC component (Glc family) [Planifilum fimeticola]|uniref:PTS system N-acetylglucosamine-specific IIB component (Glc family) /PTS system N-acetylglucosamine-specific IIC component (Glc family) n=1 Tax=Planifilum fimeticola TaxID=201975 RepID=A0A2T0LGB9_9BACL|nr:N-acetylglucosamine-specific PTS transporter subunit IIBC [Planifilum fimeticola]PRX41305.1 PTS system N-acetylglucosamine-specific IIB component (Glc family) /PTS system N-acetylglucosamine-specific IIC component (Glc family) [Planifilum fimeticola]
MLGQLQRLGKSLMLPVAVLPAVGLLLRFGQPDLLDIPFIAATGSAVLDNLPILFAIGVAIGLAKENHGAAGLSGYIAYEIITKGAQAINEDINMSVLGGIIAGILAAWLYNRYHTVKLPDYLGFFGGRRFVPIVTAGAAIVLAFVFGYVWPYIQAGIDVLGHGLTGIGAIGAAIYGFLNRLLIPLGLHHVINSYIWFVFGEYEGKTGDLHRFFAGDPTAGGFMAGFFPIFMFGLPAAALAMTLAAKKERRPAVAGFMLSAALTAFLTGITEPLEYAFMFLAPVLYVLHALLTAISLAVVYALDIRHGFFFSAGAIDYFLNMGLAERGWWLIPIGAAFFALYFLVFYFSIKAFNIQTMGRESEGEAAQSGGFSVFDEYQLASKEEGKEEEEAEGDMAEQARQYLTAMGGKENILEVEGCITRLRLRVKDASLLDEEELKRLGAAGVMKLDDQHAQVVVGTIADMLAEAIRHQLKK